MLNTETDMKNSLQTILRENVTRHYETNTVYQFRRQYVRENKSGLCPTLTANMGSGGHNVPIIKDDHGIRKLSPRDCFDLQGFPKKFILPCSNSQSYKQAGNSVTVSVIERIAINIFDVLSEKTQYKHNQQTNEDEPLLFNKPEIILL